MGATVDSMQLTFFFFISIWAAILQHLLTWLLFIYTYTDTFYK